jgi:predicted esterase YcpF (UPF0227 family)
VLIYLHGFNSSPGSHKAQLLKAYLEARGLADRYACPLLTNDPDDAVAAAEQAMAPHDPARLCLVGSSLGGFYATHLAEKHGAKAVLVNPAVDPGAGLAAYAGPQRNPYTGETYVLGERHASAWRRQFVPRVTPSRYLLLVETGDEVLDYRDAVGRYEGARQVVVEGGDHTLQSFPEHIPAILAFAGIAA